MDNKFIKTIISLLIFIWFMGTSELLLLYTDNSPLKLILVGQFFLFMGIMAVICNIKAILNVKN